MAPIKIRFSAEIFKKSKIHTTLPTDFDDYPTRIRLFSSKLSQRMWKQLLKCSGQSAKILGQNPGLKYYHLGNFFKILWGHFAGTKSGIPHKVASGVPKGVVVGVGVWGVGGGEAPPPPPPPPTPSRVFLSGEKFYSGKSGIWPNSHERAPTEVSKINRLGLESVDCCSRIWRLLAK